jgi:anthranilate phosphoribosyltransferase
MHPFAIYVRTLARGPGLSRNLTREEARDAMRLILAGDVEREQLGAFLLLMRYRGESPDELSGMIEAARETIGITAGPRPDLDWPSYADRHKQLPYFVLSALLLAANGVRVLMHGIEGETEGFVSTRTVLDRLGISTSRTPESAAERLGATGFAYLGLEDVCPALAAMIGLRPVLGLRSPIHSVARGLNPMAAPYQIQGVFHPNYRPLHREAARLLGQRHLAVFKGGAGEAQRAPDKACVVARLRDGVAGEEQWPPLPGGAGFRPREETQDPERVAALWRGELEDAAGAVAAITGTVAIALAMLGRVGSMEEARAASEAMWRARSTVAAPAFA